MTRLFFFLLLIITLGSCRTHVCSITDTTAIHDTTYIARHTRDSVYVHDSVFLEKIFQNDTLIVREKYYHNYYVGEAVHDTIYKSKTDTLIQIETVEVGKPRTASLGETIWHVILGITLGLVLFFAGVYFRGK